MASQRVRRDDWSFARDWSAAEWADYWAQCADKALQEPEPEKFESEAQARTWRFDFTSPWIDCIDASALWMFIVPVGAWDVADDLRKRAGAWALAEVAGELKRRAVALRERESSPADWNGGDWLVAIASHIQRELPASTSWTQVDAFVRHLRENAGVEIPGEVYEVVRGLIERHRGNDAVSSAEAAQVLFIHGMTTASMKTLRGQGGDDLWGCPPGA